MPSICHTAMPLQIQVLDRRSQIDLAVIIERISTLFFVPYSVEDITAILSDRLSRANEQIQQNSKADSENEISSESFRRQHLVQPKAIEMCARKIAAIGDLRKALEIIRTAIEIAEQTFNPTVFGAEYFVGLPHVVQAIEKSIGRAAGSSSRVRSALQELSIHQKIFLTALTILLTPLTNSSRTPKPAIAAVFGKYTALLNVQKIVAPLSRSEIFDLVSNLESMGLIKVTSMKKSAKSAVSVLEWESSVSLVYGREEVESILSEQSVLKSLFSVR
jgi:Cdc6-like AAA superfamily ATPase